MHVYHVYMHVYACIHMYMYVYALGYMLLPQDYIMFIPPPPHYRGTRCNFSPVINDFWNGHVNLIFKMRVRTDSGRLMECKCALVETMFNYCPTTTKPWWRSTAQVGTKLLYLPSPEPVVYVVPLSHILGKLPLVPADYFGTIPQSKHGRKDACYPSRVCATVMVLLAPAARCSTSTPGP